MKITEYQLTRDYADKYTRVWGAQSESNPNTVYTVALRRDGKWSCGCPRWTRNKERPDCKHIKFLKLEIARLNVRQQEAQIRADYNRQVVAQVERPLDPMPEQVKRKLSTFASIEL